MNNILLDKKREIKDNFYPFTAIGKNLLVNKNTGAVYEVTDKIMDFFNGGPKDGEIADSIKYLGSEKKSIDVYLETAKKLEREATSPNSLCLIMSGGCNFKCAYCYGSYGSDKRRAGNMSFSNAAAAVDFLFSQNSSKIEFDLFGGEPLLNWEVCKDAIKHIKKRQDETGKKAKIALTTNGYLFDRAKQEFLTRHGVNLVLSIDGGRACHDKLRAGPSGENTFDAVYDNLKQFLDMQNKNYYARGTYTRKTLNFYDSFKFYIDNGIEYFSLEPVVRVSSDLSIKSNDIEKIGREYKKCAELLLQVNKEKERFHFYHFNLNIYNPPCVEKKLRACAAGVKYFAVDYNGDIYPCHQFVGMKEFKMGNIKKAYSVQRIAYSRGDPCGRPDNRAGTSPAPTCDCLIIDENISKLFKKNHIFNKPKCKGCWVRVYCSGGCAASNYFHNKSIFEPDEVSCEIMKIRTKYALAYNIIRGRTSGFAPSHPRAR